jgi:glycosyltransferase involved in cell wall biosynthesis
MTGDFGAGRESRGPVTDESTVLGGDSSAREPFDIVIPYWGSFDYLRGAVESVLAQTDPGWRLTVIDDAYPDRAPGEWVQSIDDPRIVYERNDKNLGVGGTFRLAAQRMSSSFGAIVGCDDLLMPEYVARVRYLTSLHRDVSVLQPGVRVIDEAGSVYRPLVDRMKRAIMPRAAPRKLLRGERLAASLLQGNWAYFPSLVWNADALHLYPFDAEATIVPDLQLLLDVVSGGGALLIDDQEVFLYRRHAHSVSSAGASQGWRFEEERAFFIRQRDRFHAQGWRRAARAAASHWTSRFHAATLVPAAMRTRDTGLVQSLLAHAFAPLPRRRKADD